MLPATPGLDTFLGLLLVGLIVIGGLALKEAYKWMLERLATRLTHDHETLETIQDQTEQIPEVIDRLERQEQLWVKRAETADDMDEAVVRDILDREQAPQAADAFNDD